MSPETERGYVIVRPDNGPESDADAHMPGECGTLTMRFCDEIETVTAPAAVSISPGTASAHRNEGDKVVELWAISRHLGRAEPRQRRDARSSSSRSEAKRTRDPVSLARRT